MATRERSAFVAATFGRIGELLSRKRPARAAPPPPPPLTTQSSPGQIAELQQAYGADMAPPPDHEDPSPS
jgi:hypothetical protein